MLLSCPFVPFVDNSSRHHGKGHATATTIPAMRDPRLEKLADVLVNYSTGVRPGQLVRITSPSIAAPLVAELYRRVVAAGAHPMVRVSPDELSEIFLKNASDEQLKYVNPVSLFEVERIDASIGVWADENTKALTNVDPNAMGLSQAT